MSIGIEIKNDVTRAKEDVEGSDGRMNVSSRTDERSYYASRDNSAAFSLTWQDASTATGDYVLYWQNTATDGRVFVIDSIGINADDSSTWELWTVTGTGGGGTAATPVCLNRAKLRTAPANCFTAVSATVTIGAEDEKIDIVTVSGFSHEEMRLRDRLRLGQDQAIAIKCDLIANSPGLSHGVVYGFYETAGA